MPPSGEGKLPLKGGLSAKESPKEEDGGLGLGLGLGLEVAALDCIKQRLMDDVLTVRAAELLTTSHSDLAAVYLQQNRYRDALSAIYACMKVHESHGIPLDAKLFFRRGR
jgi:hypothetical protein